MRSGSNLGNLCDRVLYAGKGNLSLVFWFYCDTLYEKEFVKKRIADQNFRS